jgi:hypothetical protein
VTSRGCSAACSFCTIGPHWGRYREWRSHSADWIHRHLRRMAAAGAEYVQFVDDQFVGNAESVERAWRLVQLLEQDPVGVPFYFLCRADTVLSHPALFARLAGVGLHTVFLGLESGDDATLARLNKEHTAEQGRAAVAILDGLGVHTVAGTIVFHPWSNLGTLAVEVGFLRGLLDAFPGFFFYDLNEIDIFSNTPLGAPYATFDASGCHPWTIAEPATGRLWKAFQLVREHTLYPAMEGMNLLRNLQPRRALCAWQLDVLDAMVGAAGDEALLADIIRTSSLSMSLLVMQYEGQSGLYRYLSTADRAAAFEPEHCFE